jgi:RecB family endonuclease NucS
LPIRPWRAVIGNIRLQDQQLGVFAAQQIKPQARTLAEDRGIRCVVLDYDKLRGTDSDEFRLF